jgi:hypothetical protein
VKAGALFATNLPGWENQPIVGPLEERLGQPVLINDWAHTLAEFEQGQARLSRPRVPRSAPAWGGVVVDGRLPSA